MMAEQYGHVKISRKAYEDDPFWKERRVFSKWEAWEYLIQLAAWKGYRKMVGITAIDLERGEFLASIRYLAKAWCWGEKRVRGFLETLQIMGRISTQRRTHEGHVYVLVNYEVYQTKGATSGTAKDTRGAQQGHKEEASKAGKAKKDDVEEADLLFELAWKAYPKRQPNPKKLAHKAWTARVEEGAEPRDLLAAVDAYAKYCKAKGVTGNYVLMGQTFFGPNERWKDDYTVEENDGQQSGRAGNRQPNSGEGTPAARGKYDGLTIISGAQGAA